MPHMTPFVAFRMSTKYVKNWYSVLAVHANIISKTTVKFKDGRNMDFSKNEYLIFGQELYRRYLLDNGFTYEREGNRTIIRTPDKLRLILEKPGSFGRFGNLDEIFLMRVYGQANLKGRSVIDIGASIADTPIYFASMGASKVYGFEPDVERYGLALQNINLNNMTDKIQIFNTEANSESLANLILQYGLKNVFLKIDCEGCEYEMIANTEDDMFQNIRDVVLEYHKNPKPLIERLAKLGFKVKRRNEIIFATRSYE
jgi:16S rRNA G966 N2-methylase RsmD